jgi:nicotinate-nucleotide--dimethylbenzimidazole phosphoribosyltransferase
LLTPSHLVGQIAIKPPPSDEETTEPEAPEDDPRPGPGERVTFVEPLGEKQLQPAADVKFQPIPAPAAAAAAAKDTAVPGTEKPSTAEAAPTEPPAPAPATEGSPAGQAPAQPRPTTPPPATAETQAPAAGTQAPAAGSQAPAPGTQVPAPGTQAPPAAAAAAAALASSSPTHPVRVYLVRGVTRKGRPGPPSARMVVPLVDPPPAPGAGSVTFTESAVTLTWIPPVVEPGAPAPLTFNVYAAPRAKAAPPTSVSQPPAQPAAPAPINQEPVTQARLEHAGAQPGVEQCFVVRCVVKIGDASVESEPSAPLCVTPKDIFPPGAPKGLAIVAMDGAVMNLIWDANTEPDLAGYVVLRGEAPGDTLQPLTPQPIHETRYTDATVKPGVRYVYAIVALDRAVPQNRSAPSARVEETAR